MVRIRQAGLLTTALAFVRVLAVFGDEPPPPRPAIRNAILVSIDSLRADHLSFYGYPRPTTPALVDLAQRRGALLFERTTAVSPACHPSHVAMLTGLYPVQVGISWCAEDVLGESEMQEPDSPKPPAMTQQEVSAIVNGLVIPDDTPTLPTFLQGQGLRTAGFVSIWTIHGRFGYRRGFDRFADEMPEYYGPPALKWFFKGRHGSQVRQVGEVTINAVLDYLKSLRKDERFFLFVHLADTHTPYALRSATPFEETPAQRQQLWETWQARYPKALWQQAIRHLRKKDGETLFDHYDRSLRYVDDQLSRLFAQLETTGLLDETAIVVTSDHGDSFGQRRYLSDAQRDRLFFLHSAYVWEETQHVPLLVYLPGLAPGVTRRAVNASHVDVAPTILARLGFAPDAFSSGGSGEDLVELTDEPRTVFFMTFGRGRPGVMGKMRPDRPKFIGLRRGDVKFFADRDHFKNPERGHCFLYDLAQDGDELKNLCDKVHQEEARRYRQELVDWYSRIVARRAPRS
jgi:arylsulfatase A-like enzyme